MNVNEKDTFLRKKKLHQSYDRQSKAAKQLCQFEHFRIETEKAASAFNYSFPLSFYEGNYHLKRFGIPRKQNAPLIFPQG